MFKKVKSVWGEGNNAIVEMKAQGITATTIMNDELYNYPSHLRLRDIIS